MKKLFVLLCAALLVCATVPMAFADVDVETEVDKDWQADICIEANIEKAIYLGVKQLAPVDSSAQADVTKNDANVGNVVVEIPQIKVIPGNDVLEEPDTVIVEPVLPLAILTDWAFNSASGVISVNQAPGNANNQGNAVAVAFADDKTAFLSAAAHVEKEIGTSDERLDAGLIGTIVYELVDNSDAEKNPFANLGGTNIVIGLKTERKDKIDENAFQNATGVIGVNQSAGNCNNQDNAVAMAVGSDPTASLAEADLGMVTANGLLIEFDVDKTDEIVDYAFSSAHGVLSVNQSSGNCNNQGNTVAVSISHMTMAY
jgi:hypothetical protein